MGEDSRIQWPPSFFHQTWDAFDHAKVRMRRITTFGDQVNYHPRIALNHHMFCLIDSRILESFESPNESFATFEDPSFKCIPLPSCLIVPIFIKQLPKCSKQTFRKIFSGSKASSLKNMAISVKTKYLPQTPKDEMILKTIERKTFKE